MFPDTGASESSTMFIRPGGFTNTLVWPANSRGNSTAPTTP
jgi:hypothetical protein